MGYVTPASPRHDLNSLQPQRLNGRRPVDSELADISPVGELAKMLRAMRLLCAAGLPPDPQRFTGTVEKVGSRGKGRTLWYLKPNGCAYRVYVAQWSPTELVFLYVMEKRRWKRGKRNDEKGFSRLAELEGGTCQAVPLDIPDPG